MAGLELAQGEARRARPYNAFLHARCERKAFPFKGGWGLYKIVRKQMSHNFRFLRHSFLDFKKGKECCKNKVVRGFIPCVCFRFPFYTDVEEINLKEMARHRNRLILFAIFL